MYTNQNLGRQMGILKSCGSQERLDQGFNCALEVTSPPYRSSRPKRSYLIPIASLACFLPLAIPDSQLLAQSPSESERKDVLADARKGAEDYIRVLRPVLFRSLEGSEAKAYREIQFRVSEDDWAWKTSSSTEDGIPSVEVDVGFVRKIEMLAEAQLLEQILNKPVLIPYIRYVATKLNERATFINSASVFEHYNPEGLDGDPARHKQHVAMILNGMAFVLAHEVGHVVLGHHDQPLPDDSEARHRVLLEMESRADTWALERCVQAHFSPLGGVLAVLFEYYTTPKPLEHERNSDHPADVRRLRVMFQTMVDVLPQFRAEIEKEGEDYAEFSQSVRQSLQAYTREVETGRTPVEESSPTGRKVRGDADDDDSSSRPPVRRRLAEFCGDIHGRRYCPMISAQPIGSACTCSNLPGWGVVVP